MAQVHDVAQFILEKAGPMTTMKLQKIVYYCQAWHIAWTDDTLFDSRIEAWVDGPVTPELFKSHRGAFKVSTIRGGDSGRLSKRERKTIEKVVDFYADKSPQWLINLTHQESPWREARAGVPDGIPAQTEITPDAMGRYYSAL